MKNLMTNYGHLGGYSNVASSSMAILGMVIHYV